MRLRHRKLPQSRMIDTVLPVPPEPTGHRRWLPFGDRSRTAFAWYSILRVAFPGGRVAYLQILAAYAAGVALNGFLPANLGTAVTLLMFVAIIPAPICRACSAAWSCTRSSSPSPACSSTRT